MCWKFCSFNTFRHRFDKPGLYKIEVSVTTQDKLVGSDSILIEIILPATITEEVFTEFKKSLENIDQETLDKTDDKSSIPVTNVVLIVPFLLGASLRIFNRKRRYN
ncbi:MAG: hypothetical protein HeimC2_08880 [Candidatus Heimdallarchaeota archaeon LC_2]|nr:MAG: hypothetical protein HeimC2_08880 [Candidatus Heimdallarchaeota archaeon LC_2]